MTKDLNARTRKMNPQITVHRLRCFKSSRRIYISKNIIQPGTRLPMFEGLYRKVVLFLFENSKCYRELSL